MRNAALMVIVFFLQTVTRVTAASPLLLSTPTVHAIEVSYLGSSGVLYGVETSSDLRLWELIAASEEFAPGQFRYQDPLALFGDAGFYRVREGESNSVLNWMQTYPRAY